MTFSKVPLLISPAVALTLTVVATVGTPASVTTEVNSGSRQGSFTYDLENRAKTATIVGATTTNSFDGDGNLTQFQSGSAVTKELWDRNFALPQLALERDGSNNLIRRYANGADPIGFSTGSGASFFNHFDAFGSVANLTNAAGVTQWTNVWEPFGPVRSQTQNDPLAPADPLGFSGEYRNDATSLINLRARQYDPANARFQGADPLTPGVGEPFVSGYAYVNGMPTILADPSGLCWCLGDRLVDAVSVAKEEAKGVVGATDVLATQTVHLVTHPWEAGQALGYGMYRAEQLYRMCGLECVIGGAVDALLVQPFKACLHRTGSIETVTRSCSKLLAALIPVGKVAQLARLNATLKLTELAERARGGISAAGRRLAVEETGSVGLNGFSHRSGGASRREPSSHDTADASGRAAFFRGAKPGEAPTFAPRQNEFRVDPETGYVKPTHGVSVFNDPESVRSRGFEPHEIDRATVPDELAFIQRGRDPAHYEIVPRAGANLTPDQYQCALGKIRCR